MPGDHTKIRRDGTTTVPARTFIHIPSTCSGPSEDVARASCSAKRIREDLSCVLRSISPGRFGSTLRASSSTAILPWRRMPVFSSFSRTVAGAAGTVRAIAPSPKYIQHAGMGTLLLDLLTEHEELADATTAAFRFNIPLLAERLAGAIDWALSDRQTPLKVGVFGASTGAAAGLIAAAKRSDAVRAVVSRGGRPDLADASLDLVTVPTLLIVGGHDPVVIELNKEALARLNGPKELKIVPGATHLFEEPGTLDQVSVLGERLVRAAPEPTAAQHPPMRIRSVRHTSRRDDRSALKHVVCDVWRGICSAAEQFPTHQPLRKGAQT